MSSRIWRALVLPIFFVPILLAQTPISIVENNGFCENGASSVAPVAPFWGSYCSKGDSDSGRIVTSTFQLNGDFDIYLSGNPNGEGISLSLENQSTQQRLELHPPMWPGAVWQRYAFELPATWRGQNLRLVAEDNSSASMGWLSFTAPYPRDKQVFPANAKRLLLTTLQSALLLFIPGFTFTALAVAFGVRSSIKLGMILLCGIALPGYFVFFIYVLSARVGSVVGMILPYALAALLVFLLLRTSRKKLVCLLPLVLPVVAIFFTSLAILALGYQVAGADMVKVIPNTRFSGTPMPPDNEIPLLFAQGLWNGHVPSPLIIDWLSSDRPPLQTGMTLALGRRGTFKTPYETAAALAQSLWILGLWILLRSLRLSMRVVALVTGTIALTGFTIVNTFYVWPKLLPAAFMLAFAAPVIAVPPRNGWPPRRMYLVMGLLLALSLLSHGGTAFSLIGLVCLLVARRFQLRTALDAAITFAITLALYAPWVAYQKFVDPPGDRLLKYHLAAAHPITKASALSTIWHAYRTITLSQWLADRWQNVVSAFGFEPFFLRLSTHFMNPASQDGMRELQFFHIPPALGFLILGIFLFPFLWFKIRRQKEMRAAAILFLWTILTLLVWIILEFEPGSAVIHAGSYAVMLTILSAAILTLYAASPRLTVALCALQCIVTWLVYQPDLSAIRFPPSLAHPNNPWMLALQFVGLAGLGCTLLLMSRRKPLSKSSK